MPELPDWPDIDQLRRQARDLHRAASVGAPDALTRIHAVSDRIALSAAQLAVAREYGFSSWPALRAEVERRRARPAGVSPRFPAGDVRSAPAWLDQRYSFGAGAPIQTAEGVLSPCVLTAGSGQAILHADGMLYDPGTARARTARPRPAAEAQIRRPHCHRRSRYDVCPQSRVDVAARRPARWGPKSGPDQPEVRARSALRRAVDRVARAERVGHPARCIAACHCARQ